jgi:hypothetical protein
MLNDDSLKQRRSHARIPDAFWINDYYRSVGAHAETWRFTTLHALWTKQEIFALE